MSALASMRDRVTASFAPVRQRWHRLETRQQRIFGSGAVLLVAALLLAYVWLPAVRERERLIARLPQLSAQLALMRKQADEIRQLNSTSLITPAPPAVPDIATLQSSLGDGARVSVDPSRALRIVIPRIAYATWWDRLGDVRSRHQLDIVSLSLTALPGSHREVSIDMLLADRTRNAVSPASAAAK